MSHSTHTHMFRFLHIFRSQSNWAISFESSLKQQEASLCWEKELFYTDGFNFKLSQLTIKQEGVGWCGFSFRREQIGFLNLRLTFCNNSLCGLGPPPSSYLAITLFY